MLKKETIINTILLQAVYLQRAGQYGRSQSLFRQAKELHASLNNEQVAELIKFKRPMGVLLDENKKVA